MKDTATCIPSSTMFGNSHCQLYVSLVFHTFSSTAISQDNYYHSKKSSDISDIHTPNKHLILIFFFVSLQMVKFKASQNCKAVMVFLPLSQTKAIMIFLLTSQGTRITTNMVKASKLLTYR